MSEKLESLKASYHKHERWVPIIFFGLGFLFDAAILRRIDEPKVIVQQAIYLVIAAILIGVELVEITREVSAPFLLRKIWRYREALLHFLLGTLLNSYTIFYFKSASAITSFIFIGLLITVLILNEFKRFGKQQTKVHVAFLSLCLISYLVSLCPILMGFIGLVPFLIANLSALTIFGAYHFLLKRKLSTQPLQPLQPLQTEQKELLRTHVLFPFVAIQVVFAILYFTHAIPPVPLSVSYMGIYHDVKKTEGEYQLSYTRSKWKFWQHGDQSFSARPGDAIYCFARIFSPARFKDKLQVRWLYKDAKLGWKSSDAIPVDIVGGREEGYRGVTKKQNYDAGKWRVVVETLDGREIGQIDFRVEKDDSTEPLQVTTEVQ